MTPSRNVIHIHTGTVWYIPVSIPACTNHTKSTRYASHVHCSLLYNILISGMLSCTEHTCNPSYTHLIRNFSWLWYFYEFMILFHAYFQLTKPSILLLFSLFCSGWSLSQLTTLNLPMTMQLMPCGLMRVISITSLQHLVFITNSWHNPDPNLL